MLDAFVAEQHASLLQNNAGLVRDLQDRLIRSQVRADHIRGRCRHLHDRRSPSMSMISIRRPIGVCCAPQCVSIDQATSRACAPGKERNQQHCSPERVRPTGDEWSLVLPYWLPERTALR